MLRTFEIYLLRNFQTHDTALVTAVTTLSLTAQHLLISFLGVCDRLFLPVGSASEIMSMVLVSTDLTPATQGHQVLFLLLGSHRKTLRKVGDRLSQGRSGCVCGTNGSPQACGGGLRLPLNGEWVTISTASVLGSPGKSACFSLKLASHINPNGHLDRQISR